MGSTDGQALVVKRPVVYGAGRQKVATGNILLDAVPLNFFHCKIAALTFGAHLTEGYAIGTIAYALQPMLDQMLGAQVEHRALWEGLIGSSTLLGIFVGSLLFGWLSDRVGRQKIFLLSFVIITIAAFAQFYVQTPLMLCIMRALLGFGMGGDFAVGHAILAEFSPRKHRGLLLGSFSVIWTVGYVMANLLGMAYVQHGSNPDAWRWLLKQGRRSEADAVVKKYFGKRVILDAGAHDDHDASGGYARLFRSDLIRRTLFNGIFFVCLVIPYFAIYTFLPAILEVIHLPEDSKADLLLNGLLVIGAIIGIWLTVKLPRRTFLISSFAIAAAALAMLSLLPSSASMLLVAAFALFTVTLSAVSNLVGVYPPECFPTEVRACGVGLAVACSRLGSAAGVFLLPIGMQVFGLQVTMMALAAVLMIGMAVSVAWAPETRHLRLNECAEA